MIYYTAFFAFTYLFSKLRTRIGRRTIQQSRAFLIGILILLLMGLRDQTVAGDTIDWYCFIFAISCALSGIC